MAQNWFQHTLVRSGWSPQNQVAALVVLGLIVALIFGGAYLSQVATFATTNREIEDLIAQRDRLERENEDLRANIASLQTVPRLLERAEALGFRPATAADIEYLVIEGYNPTRTTTAAPLLETNEFAEVPQYDETFSGWLRQRWDNLTQQFERFGQ